MTDLKTTCSKDNMANSKLTSERTGFKTIETIGRLVLFIILRFWRFCSAAMLTLLLLYWLYGGVVIFLLLTAAVFGALYHYQDSFLYFPEQPLSSRMFVQNPRVLGLPYENLFIRTQDGVRINVIFIKQPPRFQATVPTILFFHGNAGNVGHRLLNAKALHNHCCCNVLLVEYRGYGKSEGSPSEYGFMLDAQAAMEHLLNRPDIDNNQIVIFGRSLGGAVAIDLASQPAYLNRAFALVVENTFTSIPAMASELLSGLHRLPYFCFRNKFDSLAKIHNTRIPTLFLSGLADQLIPPRMMKMLYQISDSSLKKLEPFEGGSHNDTWQCFGYLDAISRFISEVQQACASGVIAGPLLAEATPSSSAVLNIHNAGHTQDI